MSDTPETDAETFNCDALEVVLARFARQLERDRNYLKAMVTAANTQLDVALKERDESLRLLSWAKDYMDRRTTQGRSLQEKIEDHCKRLS